jgi:hypothetical protein
MGRPFRRGHGARDGANDRILTRISNGAASGSADAPSRSSPASRVTAPNEAETGAMTGRVMQPRKRSESKGSTSSETREDQSAELRPDAPTDESSEVRGPSGVKEFGTSSPARHHMSLHGSRESSEVPRHRRLAGGSGKQRKPRSESSQVEGRQAAKGKLADGNASRSQSRPDVLTRVERVGQSASELKGEKLTNLICHIKVPLLAEANEPALDRRRVRAPAPSRGRPRPVSDSARREHSPSPSCVGMSVAVIPRKNK